jgi:ascorbate-specific PTS system EIIC-type component UlaA
VYLGASYAFFNKVSSYLSKKKKKKKKEEKKKKLDILSSSGIKCMLTMLLMLFGI